MKIILNGQTIDYAGKPDIVSFLTHQDYAEKTIAVALNGSFVPKTHHAQTALNDNDQIDIVAPMQGG